MSDATRRVTDATGTVEWLDVKAAAVRLGVSERSVQRQAKSGDLPSQRDGRRLFVCLPAAFGNTPGVETTQESDATHAQTSHHATETGDSDATSALMEQLQSENAWLRQQVETHQTNEAELRRLMLADKHELQSLREKVTLLLAAPPIEEAPTESQEPRTTQEPADTVNQPHGTEKTAEKRTWWTRLFGR